MREYTFQDIIENIKNNWKRMIYIIVVCLFIGATCGFVNSMRLEHMDYSQDDTIVDTVELSDLDRDETFYHVALGRVRDAHNALNAYVQYLKQVEMSGDSMEKVSEMESLLASYEDAYQLLFERYECYYPIIYTDNSIAYIDEKIYINKSRVEQYATELNRIEAQTFVGISSDARRAELEAKIIKWEREIFFWEKCKEQLQSKADEERKDNNTVFNELLIKNVEEINRLVQAFNTLLESLESTEQYDIIYNKCLLKDYTANMMRTDTLDEGDIMNYQKGEALIYAQSVAGVDSTKESFLAYLLFFGMFGMACSFLYGAFWRKSSAN